MNIDLGSFAFGSIIEKGGGTPSWGTSLGQSKPDYKFTYSGFEPILIGMMYNSFPLKNVELPLGKGGRFYKASEIKEVQLASLFSKVYINGKKIDFPFLLVLLKESSDSHSGRRTIKYSDKISYSYGKRNYSNGDFIKRVREIFSLGENACWFVYSLEVYNQDELHMSAVIVNETDNVQYENSSIRKNEWLDLIPDGIEDIREIKMSSYKCSSLQTIYYGAPGTGKSHKVNEITNDENSVRTTFHPDSDYSTFVGAYKPTTQPVKLRDLSGHVVIENGEEVIDERIVYKFVPQAFLHAYVNAWKNQNEPYYLVIEEINRGNCAQIFGDLFQLLDRGSDGESSYSIKPDKDIANFLANDKLGFKDAEDIPEEIRKGTEMRLPANLHILATMNTSDQSLFPIDSAFKRRWDWEYVPIEDAGKRHFIAIGEKKYDWWNFINIINGKIDVLSGSEDKKMGYWFVKPSEGSNEITSKQFLSKVLFYLWNDIYKDYADSSQSIFRITENGQPIKTSFTSFFGYDSEKRLQSFMEYNGISEIESNNDKVETEDEYQNCDSPKSISLLSVLLKGVTYDLKSYKGRFELYLDVLRNIGMEKVAKYAENCKYNRYGCPLISKEKHEKIENSEGFKYVEADGYYVVKGINDSTKVNILEFLKDQMKLNMVIDTTIPTFAAEENDEEE